MPQGGVNSRVHVHLVSDTITRDLMTIGDDAVVIAKAVLYDGMKVVAEKAKVLTPIDPEDGGRLQDSVRVTKPSRTRSRGVSCGVKAGGQSAPYANIQHEDLTYRHTYGMAKFIERPFLQELPRIIAKLEEKIRARLERGR